MKALHITQPLMRLLLSCSCTQTEALRCRTQLRHCCLVQRVGRLHWGLGQLGHLLLAESDQGASDLCVSQIYGSVKQKEEEEEKKYLQVEVLFIS